MTRKSISEMDDAELLLEIADGIQEGFLAKTEGADEVVRRLRELVTPRPRAEWHEDLGEVLWWVLPVQEPPYVGSPLEDGWEDGYYTHFTPILAPSESR